MTDQAPASPTSEIPTGQPADTQTAQTLAENGVQAGDVLQTDGGQNIRIGSDTPPDVFSKPQSKTMASCGRVVHVYSNRWRGPRPGLVICGWGVSGTHQLINVNVMLDGANDTKVLAEFRARPDGNTLTSIGLYDPLTDLERGQLIAGPGASSKDNHPRYHCEWLPFQASGVQRNELSLSNVYGRIEEVQKRIDSLQVAAAGHFTELEQAICALKGSFPLGAPPARMAESAKLGAPPTDGVGTAPAACEDKFEDVATGSKVLNGVEFRDIVTKKNGQDYTHRVEVWFGGACLGKLTPQ